MTRVGDALRRHPIAVSRLAAQMRGRRCAPTHEPGEDAQGRYTRAHVRTRRPFEDRMTPIAGCVPVGRYVSQLSQTCVRLR